MRSIQEIGKDPKFLRHLGYNGIAGLAIDILVELADIPDFTFELYDPNSRRGLGYYYTNLITAMNLRGIDDFWKFIVDNSDDKDVIKKPDDIFYALNLWRLLIRYNLETAPSQLIEVFSNPIEYENDPRKKAELQLLEIKSLSVVPRVFDIKSRVQKINQDYLSPDLFSVYELARKYF